MRALHLAGVVAAIGMSLVAPAAANASGLITVLSVSSPAGNLGLLSVTLESTTPVVPSSITAEFSTGTSSTPVLTVNDFTLTGGVNSGATVTTWTVAEPITTGELPLGIYFITVLAADTGGDTADTGAGALDFRVAPTLTFSVTPQSYSYGQRVTLSGTETGMYPDGSTGPLAGQTVTVLGVDDATATTDSSGAYSLTLTAGIPDDALVPRGGGPYLWAEVASTATAKNADSPVVPVTITPDPFRVTNFVYSPAAISYRGAVALSGTLSYDVGGTWLPFADKGLEIDYDGYSENPCDPNFECSSAVVTADTDATGAFTVTMGDSGGTEEYSVIAHYPDWPESPWFTEPTTRFTVTVNHVPTSSVLTAARDIHNQLMLRGCIGQDVTDFSIRDMAPYPPATFQYARHRNGPWRTVPGTRPIADKVIPPTGPGHCYHARARAPGGGRVFYRMTTPASVAYLAQASPARHAQQPSRVRFRDFTVRPTSIRAGQHVNVTGQLSRLNSTNVQILFRPDGDARWRVLKTAVTFSANQNGWFNFSASLTLHQGGDVAARFAGLPEFYPAQSRSIQVTVG